jgi:hypothetical protein
MQKTNFLQVLGENGLKVDHYENAKMTPRLQFDGLICDELTVSGIRKFEAILFRLYSHRIGVCFKGSRIIHRRFLSGVSGL